MWSLENTQECGTTELWGMENKKEQTHSSALVSENTGLLEALGQGCASQTAERDPPARAAGGPLDGNILSTSSLVTQKVPMPMYSLPADDKV